MTLNFSPIQEELKKAIQDKGIPCASLLIAKDGHVLFETSDGLAQIEPPRVFSVQNYFDIASLTKPVATATLMMLAIQEKLCTLTQKVTHFFASKIQSQITIAELLNHTSGLPDWQPFYQNLSKTPDKDRKPELIKQILDCAPKTGKEAQCVYSDLGYMLLGFILETIYKQDLATLFHEKIAKPFGLHHTFFAPLNQNKVSKNNFVATENCLWRHKLLVGEVMDDNAWTLNGVAGHAGLFSTAQDIHMWLSEMRLAKLGQSLIIQKNIFDLFTQIPKNRSMSERYFTYGFDTPSIPSSSGHYFSYNSIGHLGYTGTSFWWDFDRDIWIILLTNRVHPDRHNEAIKTFRPNMHDKIMKILIPEL